MWPFTSHRLVVALSVALLGLGLSDAGADPPARVGRISFISGSVSFRPGTLDTWSAASLNYPMTTGDNVWTDPNGRAEVQLGATVARLSANTSLSILNLDDTTAQLRVVQGVLAVSVRELLPDEAVEIDTPNGAVSLLAPGFYRIEVNQGGDGTTVTVRRGAANISTASGAFDLSGDQSATVTGLAEPRFVVQAAVRPDEWEDWCEWRERRAASVMADAYVSRGTIGYDDLGEFGVWQVLPEYGPVWIPHVHAEWAPYRFGRWLWVEPWGWTWVDDAPWGFAPFHYGRWTRLAVGWAWVPGTFVARPIYAPALVVFVGGPGWGVSIGIGEPIAWFPLGPREPFVPAYRVAPEYLRAVNRSHINITTPVDLGRVDWVNRFAPGAVTAVPRGVFVQGRQVGSATSRLPEDVLRRAPVVGAAARVTPEQTSIVGQAAARGSIPPPEIVGRRVIARAPPPAPPVPFGARQPALAAHPGDPVDPDALGALRPPSSAGPVSHPLVRQVAPPATNRPTREPVAPGPDVPRALPRGVSPGASPNNAPLKPSVPLGDLASRQAAERARMEAEHAAAQAKLRAQQEEQQRKAQDERARQQAQQRQEQAQRELEQRQKQEHAQTERRQEKETEKRQEKERGQAVPRQRPR